MSLGLADTRAIVWAYCAAFLVISLEGEDDVVDATLSSVQFWFHYQTERGWGTVSRSHGDMGMLVDGGILAASSSMPFLQFPAIEIYLPLHFYSFGI